MTNNGFDRYIKNSVIQGPGKRVLLKVDSGPGCNGRDLILIAQFWGVYIYPGLPNTALRWKMAKLMLTMSKPSQQTSPQCSKRKNIVLFTLCIIIIASLFSYAIIYWDGTELLQN